MIKTPEIAFVAGVRCVLSLAIVRDHLLRIAMVRGDQQHIAVLFAGFKNASNGLV